MQTNRDLEADVLRDLLESGGGTESYEDPWDPPPGQCGMATRDGGRWYTVKRFDSWWGIARRVRDRNPDSKLSTSQYSELMRNDSRNRGKRMWSGTVIYLPPVPTDSGWQMVKC
jgi:hypothetical protein